MIRGLIVVVLVTISCYVNYWLIKGKPYVLPWEIDWNRVGKIVGWIGMFLIPLMAVAFLFSIMANAQ